MFEDRKLCIIGSGGFARETLLVAKAILDRKGLNYLEEVIFLTKDSEYTEDLIMGIKQIKDSDFDPSKFKAVVAISNSSIRRRIVNQLPVNTEFCNLVHPLADISDDVDMGVGNIITSGVIITCNVMIGNHCQFNLQTTVGHDNCISDYVTTAPSVNISGNCKLEEGVYFGTGAMVREGLSIIKDTLVGMGAVVVKSIGVKGTYIGNPAKLLS